MSNKNWDTLTRILFGLAFVWLMCAASALLLSRPLGGANPPEWYGICVSGVIQLCYFLGLLFATLSVANVIADVAKTVTDLFMCCFLAVALLAMFNFGVGGMLLDDFVTTGSFYYRAGLLVASFTLEIILAALMLLLRYLSGGSKLKLS